MNEEAYKRLEKIFLKSIAELTPEDIAFLRARRSYLSAAKVSLYQQLFKDEPKKQAKPTKESGFEGMSYKQLQSTAAKLGMPKIVGISRDVLETYITNNSKE